MSRRPAATLLRSKKKPKAPDWGRTLGVHLLALNLPSPVRELRFHPTRQFRFDFAWPDERVALEIEGGVISGRSRHTSYAGFTEDCVKYNDAACLGWIVLRVTPAQLESGMAAHWLARVLLRGRASA